MTAVFVKINVETHYLWRAVDHEGEVLEVFANRRQDHKAAIKFLKRAVKLHGRSKAIVNDRLRSYRAAMNMIGTAVSQECGRGFNNHFNQDRDLNRRDIFKQSRSAALAEWRRLMA